MRPNKIIIHHSLTKDSGTVSWGAIRTYHKKVNRWNDIGYHFGIEDVNNQTEILMGRMPRDVGAHTLGHNNSSIGICVVGNYDLTDLGLNHKKALVELLRWLRSSYKIPVSRIYGHRDFNSARLCPGESLYDFLQVLKGKRR